MDKSKCRELRAAMNAALAEVGEHFGVDITLGNASFNADNATFKLFIAELDKTGEAKTIEATHFRRNAAALGFSPDDLGREFSAVRSRFVLIGMNPRARTYPMLAREVTTGRQFKFHPSTVRSALAAGPLPS